VATKQFLIALEQGRAGTAGSLAQSLEKL
jgi:hypothetical protein